MPDTPAEAFEKWDPNFEPDVRETLVILAQFIPIHIYHYVGGRLRERLGDAKANTTCRSGDDGILAA